MPLEKYFQNKKSTADSKKGRKESSCYSNTFGSLLSFLLLFKNSFQQAGCGWGRPNFSPATALGQSPARFGGQSQVVANEEAWSLCRGP